MDNNRKLRCLSFSRFIQYLKELIFAFFIFIVKLKISLFAVSCLNFTLIISIKLKVFDKFYLLIILKKREFKLILIFLKWQLNRSLRCSSFSTFIQGFKELIFAFFRFIVKLKISLFAVSCLNFTLIISSKLKVFDKFDLLFILKKREF